ncbi:Crp/Fnr family transcriptional regulator [Neotamlana sedimentorum]|uniref:Crp/Fnr family transcriptional regulator n=1 Tax=Neotamlana sedimentorum TaxID=1435349 RepID=UPI00069BBD13|nr:cyclic nucleotide-binding domain-containing protein [Tamlana sedimentorum]
MNFLEFYNKILDTAHKSCKEIPFSVGKTSFKKGSLITEYNHIEDKIYFINSGIAEMTIKSYMTEKVIDFFFENELICGYTSFLTQEPTDVQIKALMNCEMEVVKKSDLMLAYESSLEANKFGRICTEQGYIRKSDREKNFLTKTAEELYVEMFQSRSQYISEIPVNKIAKYLGIHPESLSRIRKKINS